MFRQQLLNKDCLVYMKRIYTLLIICLVSQLVEAQSYNWSWAKQVGLETPSDEIITTTKYTKSGEIIIAGFFSGTSISFDSITLYNKSGNDIFIVKYDANKNVVWAKSAGGLDDDRASTIEIDNNGNIYLGCSSFSNFFKIDTVGISNNSFFYSNFYLIKLDSKGKVKWVTTASGKKHEYINDIEVDKNGNVYTVGYFQSDTCTFNDSISIYCKGLYDGMFIKYDSLGNLNMLESFGSNGYDEYKSIRITNNGQIYLTGFYNGNIQIGDTVLENNTSNARAFLAKFTETFNRIWIINSTGSGYQYIEEIALDKNENIYMLGRYNGTTMTFENNSKTNYGSFFNADFFLSKFNKYGNLQWLESGGGAGHEEGRFLQLSESGKLYLGVYVDSKHINYGLEEIYNPNTDNNAGDLMVLEIDTNAIYRSALFAGGSKDEQLFDLAYHQSKILICATSVSDTIHFGNIELLKPSSSLSTTFFAEVGLSTGVFTTIKPNFNCTLYPNPCTSQITITTETEVIGTSYEIYNTIGMCLGRGEINSSSYTIQVDNLPEGIYYLLLHDQKLHNLKFYKK